VVGGGQDHEAPARRALRRPDEVLGREDPQRLAHGRAAHAELHAERSLVGEAVPRADLPADDELAQLVGDLLVRLAHALDPTERVARLRHGMRNGSP
jgi:hypothetical protein